MPKDKPIKCIGFSWRTPVENNTSIGAIQVILSNGIKSSFFHACGAKPTKKSDQREIEFKEERVCSISGAQLEIVREI